jgi:hypothetical protein
MACRCPPATSLSSLDHRQPQRYRSSDSRQRRNARNVSRPGSGVEPGRQGLGDYLFDTSRLRPVRLPRGLPFSAVRSFSRAHVSEKAGREPTGKATSETGIVVGESMEYHRLKVSPVFITFVVSTARPCMMPQMAPGGVPGRCSVSRLVSRPTGFGTLPSAA